MRVRLLPLLLLWAIAPAPNTGAQNQDQRAVITASDGGAYGPMQSIFVPPKAGAPFSLKLASEWVRPLGNGGTYTLANERRIMRDGRGRIYQERWIMVPKGGAVRSWMNVFQITDPEQHTWYNCQTKAKVCEILTYHLTAEDTYVPPIGTTGPTQDGNATRQHEDLGTGSVLGVETHGYRETVTVRPGAMGNDAPMVRAREFWYSPDLGFNLQSTVETPEAGKQVFTVKELTLGEPDATFFIVPDDYKAVDHRQEQQ